MCKWFSVITMLLTGCAANVESRGEQGEVGENAAMSTVASIAAFGAESAGVSCSSKDGQKDCFCKPGKSCMRTEHNCWCP